MRESLFALSDGLDVRLGFVVCVAHERDSEFHANCASGPARLPRIEGQNNVHKATRSSQRRRRPVATKLIVMLAHFAVDDDELVVAAIGHFPLAEFDARSVTLGRLDLVGARERSIKVAGKGGRLDLDRLVLLQHNVLDQAI